MVRLIALVACLAAIGSSAAPIFRRAALEPVESEDPKDWPSKAQLQKALATAPGKAFFWSGQTNGVRVFEHAQEVALKAGGTTLEVALTKAGFKMPGFPRKSQAGKDKWVEAAGIYAAGASGDVNVVLGRQLRERNVFERLEKVNLEANPKVTSITKIDQITGEKSILFQRNKKRHEDDVELEHDENAQVEARDLDLEDLPIEEILLEKRAKKTTAKPKAAPKPKPVAKKPAPKPAAPKKTAAPKPAAPKKTAAPKPAAPKKTTAPKPAAPKKTAAPKPAAPKPAAPKKTAAPKPAAPKKTAAPKPATPKKTTAAAKKPATTKAAAPKPTKAAAKTTKAAAAKTTAKATSKKVAPTKSASKKATATKSATSKKPTASKTPPNLQGFEDLDI